MADRNLIVPADGETRFGGSSPGTQGGLFIQNGNSAALTLNNGQVTGPELATKGSWLALQAVNASGVGTTWYLFVTVAGQLRIANAVPTNTETDGSAV